VRLPAGRCSGGQRPGDRLGGVGVVEEGDAVGVAGAGRIEGDDGSDGLVEPAEEGAELSGVAGDGDRLARIVRTARLWRLAVGAREQWQR
jgi:hypothetical protein